MLGLENKNPNTKRVRGYNRRRGLPNLKRPLKKFYLPLFRHIRRHKGNTSVVDGVLRKLTSRPER